MIPVFLHAVALVALPTAPEPLCAPLKQVIASGDAFRTIQRAQLESQGKQRYWASSIELPGSSTRATIKEDSGERVFQTEFGAWENQDITNQPSLPDQEEADNRFKALKAALLACLPDWTRTKEGWWNLVLTGPTHALQLAVTGNDEESWMILSVFRKAAAERLLGLPQPTPTASSASSFTHPLVSLTLPAGWTVWPKSPNDQPDLIASFGSSALGANAAVNSPRGLGSLDNVLKHGRGTVYVSLKGAIPSERVDTMQTAGGDRVLLEDVIGTASLGGKDQALRILIAATVNSRRALIIRMYAPVANGAQAKVQFGEIIRSIR